MCLGIPGQIVEVAGDNDHLAIAAVAGVRRTINVGLLADDGGVEAGDWVLIHVGFAMNRLSAEELELVRQSLQMMADGHVEEIEAELPSRSPAVGQMYEESEGPAWVS